MQLYHWGFGGTSMFRRPAAPFPPPTSHQLSGRRIPAGDALYQKAIRRSSALGLRVG